MENWKAIPGYEEIYEASDHGRVRRISVVFRGRKPPYILKPQNYSGGYHSVSLHKEDKQRSFLLHRLIMAAFRGPSKLHVNHKDGDKKNNFLENLEYCTTQENNCHAKENKLHAYGERCSFSKLTEEKVREIRRRFASGENYKEIATHFQIHPMNIYHIVNRKTWKQVA
jgi:hypothetical protein